MSLLHAYVSQIASIVLVYTGLFLIMENTLGFIPVLRAWTLFDGRVDGRSLLFSAIALLIMWRFFSFPRG